jgi:Na+:H+ antiporter, NhaA family
MLRSSLKVFFKSEIAIGISLLVATTLALLIANSSGYEAYRAFFAINLPNSSISIHTWINDALMAIFFLLIGLELKKEILVGELSSRKKFLLPAIAALGGIIFPALIFIFCNLDHKENLRAFAVPTATDIAFAYGMISLFGKKVSNSVKVFLVALAVLDDLVAILIIAFFYSQQINLTYLGFAIVALFILAFFNFKNFKQVSSYLIVGFFLWIAVFKSGIHPTIAGVLLALFIPLQINNKSILANLAHKISPIVNFLILPIFAFANAGVRVESFSAETFLQPMVFGIILALFFGKQIGVMLFSFCAVKLNLTHLPRGSNWLEFYAAAIFTGIGFTMSLFIGTLAFFNNELFLNEIKIGVLSGSFLSAIFGMLVIFCAVRRS